MLIRILVGLVLIILIEFYFMRRLSGAVKFLFPRSGSKVFRINSAIFLLFLNVYPFIILINWTFQLIWERPSPLALQGAFYDYFLIYPFWGGIIIIIQSVLLFLPFEIIKLILRLFIGNKDLLRRISAIVIIGITILAVLYVPPRIFYDYYNVNFNEVTIERKDLTKDLEDFRLVFISDMQADRYTDGKRLSRYIDIVNNANPDLVLVAGDFITSGPEFIDTAAVYAGAIHSRLGTYSCIGDHDHWAYREDMKRSLREISSALADKNIYLIHNQNLLFHYKSARVLITFVTNSYVTRIGQDSLDGLIGSREDADLDIFLSHQPRPESIKAAADAGYEVFLAGHTHGGQITFLFPFTNLSPTLFETKFVHGNFQVENMKLIVSSGLGMSLAPFRYNSTPEVILIRFKSSNRE